ncbi:hypothetical protein INR49_017820 [Caranx melampygus]|nr:hypothetical protein INR49_017820 [Caranx melampygus]
MFGYREEEGKNQAAVGPGSVFELKCHIVFQQQPLQFAVMVREILRKERVLLGAPTQIPNPPQYQQYPNREYPNTQDVDHLVLKVLELQDIGQKIHQVQEEVNWERQNYETLQGPIQQNGLDPAKSEIQKLQNHIQQLEYNVKAMATKRFQLLQESVDCLEQCQTRLVSRLKTWRWEQHKAAIGHPFDENLNPLQTWCEQLLGVNRKLRQELMLLVEPIPELQERLGQLLQVLIQSTLVVDKQPPQVIKTQSKFSTTVRYLLGEKVAPGKPVVVKVQIINELQARNLGSVPGDNVGELINNTAILEHNTTTKSTCATFRNMFIKKIKRADRKGSESVTEEKFALLFSTEITITGCDTPYRIQMISLPVVVIVHGSQDNNALATIIWDCAFSEPERVPFVVPERVPWRMMSSTLNSKFTSEVQTQHNLDHYNQHFLAQKIFDKPDFVDDFSNMMVSWAQFNKNIQPFTKRDLEIRSLGDRIRDISHITHLYPDFPKHDVFKKFYSEPQPSPVGGYIPVTLHTKVGMPQFQPPFSPQESINQDIMETASNQDEFSSATPVPFDELMMSGLLYTGYSAFLTMTMGYGTADSVTLTEKSNRKEEEKEEEGGVDGKSGEVVRAAGAPSRLWGRVPFSVASLSDRPRIRGNSIKSYSRAPIEPPIMGPTQYTCN